MKTPNNPFVLSGYYGANWFCDRKEEFKTITEDLQNERNVVLYAWRRMGKTALIRCLFDLESRQNRMESVYIDLLGTQGLREAIQSIAQAVHHTYGRTSAGVPAALRRLFSAIGVNISFNELSGAPEISLGIRATVTPEHSLQAIGQYLSQRKKTVVIALDEFQQISSYREKNAEAIFRTWMQDFPAIRFIYSGSHRGMMQAMFTEKKRPFYQSSRLVALGPINEDVYATFIENHFSAGKKEIDRKAIQKIYQWSRGQTYCIQLACNILYDRYKSVGDTEADEAFELVLEQEIPVFANYPKMLTALQWEVMRAIAREEPLANPLGKEFIMTHQLGASSSVSTALKALQKKELVIQDGGHYLIHDVLLARWLQRV